MSFLCWSIAFQRFFFERSFFGVTGPRAARRGPLPFHPRHPAPIEEFANFRRLVLGSMDSYDSEKRRILQHFSRSTRFAFLCTAPNSNLQSFAPLIFAIFCVTLSLLWNFAEVSFKSVIFRRDFHRILPELRQIADTCQHSLYCAIFKSNVLFFHFQLFSYRIASAES